MKFLKLWLQCLLVVMLVINKTSANIDDKENFCGMRLARALSELCATYNSPSLVHNRVKRQIVQECCKLQCSRRYLVDNYCFEANSAYLSQLTNRFQEKSVIHEANESISKDGPAATTYAYDNNDSKISRRRNRANKRRSLIIKNKSFERQTNRRKRSGKHRRNRAKVSRQSTIA